MGCNVERVVLLLVFNERWLFLFRREKKMEKAPRHRRGNEEYGPISESCARLNILHLRRCPGEHLGSVTSVDFRFFRK